MHLVKRTLPRLSTEDLASECQDDCLFDPPIHSRVQLVLKDAVDRTIAAIAIVLSAPLMGLLFVLVRLTSRGPAIYSQLRIGQHGELYHLYKFRSMYQDCEKNTGPVWASRHDSRVTPMGKVLRASFLDELPQLFNVLFGHMSIVGPRPERPEIAALLRRQFPNDYYKRLLVKPGITGLAQIRQAADLDVDDVRRKLHYDLVYVRAMSPWLDFKLMLGTFSRVLKGPNFGGAKPGRAARATLTVQPLNGHHVGNGAANGASAKLPVARPGAARPDARRQA